MLGGEAGKGSEEGEGDEGAPATPMQVDGEKQDEEEDDRITRVGSWTGGKGRWGVRMEIWSGGLIWG
jgi:hypothetical protein